MIKTLSPFIETDLAWRELAPCGSNLRHTIMPE